jgi:hypothetical protein
MVTKQNTLNERKRMSSILDIPNVVERLLFNILSSEKYRLAQLPEGVEIALNQLRSELELIPLAGEPIDDKYLQDNQDLGATNSSGEQPPS